MSFSIQLLEEPVPQKMLEKGEKGVMGRIIIGERSDPKALNERIIIATNYWSPSDYIRQWMEALHMITDGPDNAKSALITEMYNPANPRWAIFWWPLYREKNSVYIHSQYLIDKDMRPLSINLNKLYSYVDDRAKPTEGGDEVSEWEVSVDDMREFLDKLEAKFL